MPVIRLRGFMGAMPATNPRYLTDHNALEATNLELWNPALRPMKGPLILYPATTPTSPQGLFAYANSWFEWEEPTQAVGSPVSNEAYGRVYFTGSTGPWVTDSGVAMTGARPYPNAEYRPGVPAPSSAPTGTPGGTGSITEKRYYVYCAVNEYGEIGPPSPPSAAANMSSHANCSVAFSTVPAGAYKPIAKYYIYRSNVIGSGFQFAGEATSSPFVDTTEALGEFLPSTEWDPPPTNLKGLVSLPNSIQAAFRANEVCMSEPGLPHAWPVAYRRSVDYNVVALGAIDSGAAILTTGQPYLMVGTHPAAMAPVRLEVPYACVSAQSVVQFGQEIVYASTHGLVRVGGGGAVLLTEAIWTKEQWDRLRPATFKAFNYRGMYTAFSTAVDGTQYGLLFDPLNPDNGVSNFTGVDPSGFYEDLGTGDVYMAAGGNIARWGVGANQTARWRSKKYELPAPASMNTVQVLAEQYPVLVTVYRDGVEQARVQIGSSAPRRVANSRLGREYSVDVVSPYEVSEVVLASSMEALRGV